MKGKKKNTSNVQRLTFKTKNAFAKRLTCIEFEKSEETRTMFGKTARRRSLILRIGCSSSRRDSSVWSMPCRLRVPGITSLANCCAQAAESRKDFIHKLGICHKELKEIQRWLRLNARMELVSTKRVRLLLLETEELIRIFAAGIRTAEKNTP